MRSGGKEKIHNKVLFLLKVLKLVNSCYFPLFIKSHLTNWHGEKSEIITSPPCIRKLQQDQEKIKKTNTNQIKLKQTKKNMEAKTTS